MALGGKERCAWKSHSLQQQQINYMVETGSAASGAG